MTAVLGLIGVALGALMTQVGSALSDRRQIRIEASRWRRDQKVAAYDGALRYLLRAANLRSEMILKSGTLLAVLSEEAVPQMFDDLVEAQFWVHTLATRCGAAQTARIRGAAARLDELIGFLARSSPPPKNTAAQGNPLKPYFGALTEAIAIVTECSREDNSDNSNAKVSRLATPPDHASLSADSAERFAASRVQRRSGSHRLTSSPGTQRVSVWAAQVQLRCSPN